ncbi:aldehyde dehydrogenase family protein [Halobacteriovorax marinus]|mgnify:CR=1 FL=1|uniref:Aldehyde dehydrogenase n=1 Tax=Halobacteriovorax marinus TaxID=97084 RepID=A0A1Y5F258_9BACT|nr:aldehyde dehydrogenase family protein [Halobacteriovorax marinus]
MNLQKIDEIVQNQRHLNKSQAFPSMDTRLKLLNKLEIALAKFEKKILQALYDDLGKNQFEAQISEFLFVQNELISSKKNLKKWLRDTKVKTPLVHYPAKSFIRSEPYGSVLIISPWNYPFQLLFSPLIGAICAGNRVVLKPSEISKNTSRVVYELINETFDESEISCIEGGIEETTRLLDNHFDYIFYTGNGTVGRIVMNKASKNLTPVTLELGGKSPCFVFGDQKLDLTAKRIVSGKFFNAGQTCIAPDYILVQEDKYEELVNNLKKYVTAFYGKDPKKSPDYGRIINERHFDRLKKLVCENNVILGGESSREEKYFAPTIVLSNESDEIMKDEIFGPILPIIKMSNLKEAIDFVQERSKPLACYIFSLENKIQNSILNRVSCGGVTINDTLMHITNEHLPFGGVGESGMGGYHGKFSFDLFSHQKSIFKASHKIDFPIKYPPFFGKLSLLRWLLRFFG